MLLSAVSSVLYLRNDAGEHSVHNFESQARQVTTISKQSRFDALCEIVDGTP